MEVKQVHLPGHENDYDIRSDGTILRCTYYKYPDGRREKVNEYRLHPSLVNGFPVVQLSRKTEYIHKLIMETFNPNHRQDRTLIFHIDGDKLNNNVSNLIWVNASERTEWSRKPIEERVRNMRLRIT